MIQRFIRNSFDASSSDADTDVDDLDGLDTDVEETEKNNGNEKVEKLKNSTTHTDESSASTTTTTLPISSTTKRNSSNGLKSSKKHSSTTSIHSQNHSHSKKHLCCLHQQPPARERPKDDNWPERECLSFTRSLVFYGTGSMTTNEHAKACQYIMECRALRKKYHGSEDTIVHTDNDELERICKNEQLGFCFNDDGIVEVFVQDTGCYDGCMPKLGTATSNSNSTKEKGKSLITVPDIDEFIKDYRRMEVICADGAMRSFW